MMEAQALQMPRLPIVFIPHPVGGLKPKEVAERALVALHGIETIWKDLLPGGDQTSGR